MIDKILNNNKLQITQVFRKIIYDKILITISFYFFLSDFIFFKYSNQLTDVPINGINIDVLKF
jgi:hypothetical protein